MKIIRYRDGDDNVHYAAERDGTHFKIAGDIYTDFTITDEAADIAKLLAPVEPTAILCVGLNYKEHAEEAGMEVGDNPVLFVKGINAVQNPDDPIVVPKFLESEEVDYECELAVVIKKACKNVIREHALEYVLGYTCSNDVSARDWQLKKGGGQWCRGKFFDTFGPLGPCLVTTDEITDPGNLNIRTILNGNVVQDSNTSDMEFDVARIIEFLSGSTTLLPGTVILTGTPPGVGMSQDPPRWLKEGDVVTIEIEGIGKLTNPVEDEKT